MAVKHAAVADLTEGGVVKQLLRYAAPLVLASFLQALYSIADMIIAGRFIGASGLSAINNASQLSVLITNIALGLATGGSIVVGQCFGAGEHTRQKQVSGTLVSLMLLLGLAVALTVFTGGRGMLTLLRAPSLEAASRYLRICAWGFIPVFVYNGLSSVMRAVGNSRRPLLIIATTTVLNVGLDLLFIGRFGWGTAGAAAATVIAQSCSMLLALFYLLGQPQIMEFTRAQLRIRRAHLRVILRLGLPAMLQMTIASISWLTVTFLINGYGEVVSAGNGVSIKIKDFCQLFIAAMANAATLMIAQNLGAGKFERARQVMYTAMAVTVTQALVLIGLVELFAPQLAAVFSDEAPVIAAAVQNLRIEILGQLFYAVFLVYHALAVGAGHTTFAMFSSFINCIVVRVVLALLFEHYFGLTGLYWACMIAPSVSMPLGWLYTRSNRWRRSLVAAEAPG